MESVQLKKFLSRLPEGITKYEIFCNYIKPDMILTELNQILNSKDSRKLNPKPLYYYLKNIVLSNSIVVENLINNNKIFNIIYDKHITKKEKNFVLIKDPIESMALAWLMYLYH